MLNFRLSRKLFNTTNIISRYLSKMDPPNAQNVPLLRGESLTGVIDKLESYAPLRFAEEWDNVGLLIEPYQQKDKIRTIFLTNDLTLKVMEEALTKNADMIISYHPPIFAPLKRITQGKWKEKIISMCLGNGIAVYSPHTAWDNAPNGNGVNSWLSKALPPDGNAKPIIMNSETLTGPGLVWSSCTPCNLGRVIEDVQTYIGLPLQVAMGVGHSLESNVKDFSCCAGSGASVLKKLKKTDVFLTGEMSHHELLDAQHQNITVIVCNHSNSERGFLKYFKPKLHNMLNSFCEIIVSECDADPLTAVFNKNNTALI